jgi:PadR family transcriptional regulator AphA
VKLSKTAYVILGMLKLGKRTGYEIKSLVDVSTRFFWAASYGQIYPELARLEELGLVEGRPDSTNGRRRKAYELTPAGEEALHEWLTSQEPLHIEFRHEGALKFFFSDCLSPDEQLEQLRRLREVHQRVGDELRQIEPAAREAASETGRRLPYLTLDFGIAFQDFVADWCERAERELAREPAKRR